MAKYRIKWRNVLFNLPMIIMVINQLRETWPAVRKAAVAAVKDDPKVSEFIAAVDQLIYVFRNK